MFIGSKLGPPESGAEELGPQEVLDDQSFESQFLYREKLRLLDEDGEPTGEKVDIVDVIPENLKDEVPVMMAPGFGSGPETLKLPMKALFGYGRRVVTFDAPHGIDATHVHMENVAPDQFAERELTKATALQKTLEQKQIERMDGVAHSEGCIYLLIAALENPERFRNLVLVNPGGMIGEDNAFAIIKRAHTAYRDGEKRAAEDPEVAEASKHGAEEREHNIFGSKIKSLKAAEAIAKSQVHELLGILKKEGIRIVVIHGADDPLFEMDRVQEVARKFELARVLDGFYSVRGGHSEFTQTPEIYGKLVEHTLKELAMRSEGNRPSKPSL